MFRRNLLVEAMEYQLNGVEELVSRTTLLNVEEEQEWDDVDKEVEAKAEVSLFGR